MDTAVPFFVAGGTVPPGSPSYVERAADRELLEALLAREFCFVLNSRQMGKSSLAVRTIAKLNDAGVRTAFVDLTRLGATGADPERWYAGLLAETGRALGLRAEAMAYLKANAALPAVARLFAFLRDEALARVEGPIVLMVDEIDAVRSLPFPADDLFAGLRELHNARAADPALGRLTVCLLGAALPSDLIVDPRRTPFNVGRRIELRDFTADEARPFAAVVGEAALARVLHWTGGHPFLTQALCAALAEPLSPPEERGEGHPISGRGGRGERSQEAVDALVRSRYLDARARDTDTNLADVANRLLGNGDPNVDDARRADVLALYERVLRGKPVADDEASPAAARIKMSGVARVEDSNLRVRNRIYAAVFDAKWVREAMPGQELRRQRKAFYRGVLRTGLVSAAVLAVVSTLAVVATNNAKAARTSEGKMQTALREVELQRKVAEGEKTEAQGERREADRQRDSAKTAQRAVTKVNAALAKAVTTQELLRRSADAAAGRATGLQHLAESKSVEASHETLLARQSAEEATKQRRNAEAQTVLVRRGEASLRSELYENTIESVCPYWERGNRAGVADIVGSLKETKGKGWEWGYWRRTSGVNFVLTVPPRASGDKFDRSNGSLFVPSEGSSAIVLSYTKRSAYRIDANTGRRLADLWQVPVVTFGPSSDSTLGSLAISRNGRWAVHETSSGRVAMQDLENGSTHDLEENTDTIVPNSVSNDGRRYLSLGGIPTETSGAQKVTVRDGQTGRSLYVHELPTRDSEIVWLSADGRTALLSFHDSKRRRFGITEYDVESGRTGTTYSAPLGLSNLSSPMAARFAATGLVVVKNGRMIAVFDRGHVEPRYTLDARTDSTTLMVRDEAGLFASSGTSVTSKSPLTTIWNLQTGVQLGSLPIVGTFSRDGRLLYNCSLGRIEALDWRRVQPCEEVQAFSGEASSTPTTGTLSFGYGFFGDDRVARTTSRYWPPDAKGSAAETRIACYDFYDLRTGARSRYPATGEIPKGLAPKLLNSLVLVNDGHDHLEVRRPPDFRLLRTLSGLAGTTPDVVAQGNRAVSIDLKGTLRVWSDRPTPLVSLPTGFVGGRLGSGPIKGTYQPSYCDVTPDGSKFLVSDVKRGFRVWDFPTLRPIASAHFGPSEDRDAWWRNGANIFTSPATGGLDVYSLASRASRPIMPASEAVATALYNFASSPDGRLIAILEGSDVVAIRSTRTGRRLFTVDTSK